MKVQPNRGHKYTKNRMKMEMNYIELIFVSTFITATVLHF